MRRFLSVAVALLVAGGASAQSAPGGSIRTGTWDLEVVYGGGTIEGRLELTPSGDSLVAKLFVGDHESPVKAGKRDGNRLALVSTAPGMDIGYTLEFDADSVTGSFTYDSQPGTVKGKRRLPGR